MSCGAALYFDDETDAAVRGLWQVIEDAGLPSEMLGLNYPPHMSVFLCEDMDVDGMRSAVPEFIARHPPVPVTFHSLGVFGVDGVVYLAPTVNHELLDFHAELWDLLTPYTSKPNLYYQPGLWVPHVTLDLDVPKDLLGAVVATLHRAGLRPGHGLVKELAIDDFETEEPGFQELFKARLGSYL